MKPNLSKYYLHLSLVLLAVFAFAAHHLNTRYVTSDDLNFALLNYGDWIITARDQGRVEFFITGLLSQIPYFFHNFLYFKTMQIGASLGLIFAIAYLIGLWHQNKSLGVMYAALALGLWQNTKEHNIITAYPFYIAFSIFLLVLSSIFFLKYLRATLPKKHKQYLIYSLLIWALTLRGGELMPLYTLLFWVIAASEEFKTSRKWISLTPLKKIKWHIGVTFLSVAVYIIFRSIYPSKYSGNSELSWSIIPILQVIWNYSVGLFPAYPFLKQIHAYEPIHFLNIRAFFSGGLLFFILWRLRPTLLRHKKESIGIFILQGCLTFFFIFSPNLLISLTQKYQDWVIQKNSSDYVYSSISFFFIAFFILLVISRVSQRKVVYTFLIAILSGLCYFSQINNDRVNDQQYHIAKRWILLDAFVLSDPHHSPKAKEAIHAPTLWSPLIHRKDYWNKYSSQKLDREIHIQENEKAPHQLKYIDSEHPYPPYLIYYKNGSLRSVYTDEPSQSKQDENFLLYFPELGDEIDILDPGGFRLFQDRIIYSKPLQDPHFINRKVIRFDFTDYDFIQENSPHSFSTHSPFQNNRRFIEFEGALEKLQMDPETSWRESQGTIKIHSLIPRPAKLKLKIESTQAGILEIISPQSQKTIPFKNQESKEILLSVNLTRNREGTAIELIPKQPKDSKAALFKLTQASISLQPILK